MREVYRKKLTYSESRRHFILILKGYIDEFPAPNVSFYVVVNDKKFEVASDSQHRILAAIFWEKLPSFRQEDTIIFKKNEDDSYNVTIEKGKLDFYPT